MSASTVTSNLAQQTSLSGQPPFQGATPPLLPAFLITGLLLAAIVFIIVWRHLIERRNAHRDDDPTWPVEGLGGNPGGHKGPTPKLWDLEVVGESARVAWGEIMPLSAAPLHAKPQPRRPRYLVPSDRPVPFLSRMFGSERRALRPPIPVLPSARLSPIPNDSEDEEPIDRLQVAVLISLPHPHRARRTSYLTENARESTDTRPEKSSLKSVAEVSEADSASSLHKGKKRSLETPPTHGNDLKAYYDYDDEDYPLEVAFGTVVLPFAEKES